MIDLNAFGGAGVLGCWAAAYALAYQTPRFNRKQSRLSKRDMTITRQELIAAHMTITIRETSVRMKDQ